MAKVLQCIYKSWRCDDLDQVYGKVNMGCPCIWMGKTVKMSFEGKSQQEPRNWQMDRILIILKKENGPRASSAPALGLNNIIFKHVYWYMQQTQVSVYRTIGPLVCRTWSEILKTGFHARRLIVTWCSGGKADEIFESPHGKTNNVVSE